MGLYFITQERIESLLDIVKSNELVQGKTYADILERWKQGKYEKLMRITIRFGNYKAEI